MQSENGLNGWMVVLRSEGPSLEVLEIGHGSAIYIDLGKVKHIVPVY